MITNREMVEETFAAFQRGDIEAAFATATDDFEFENRTDAPGVTGVWPGVDGFLEMMGKVLEAFSEYSLERLETTDHGDRVTLTLRERGRGVSSGIEIERRIYTTYRFRGDRIARIEATLEPPEA